jgi:uncharacterized membrane protein (UPF0127 family)
VNISLADIRRALALACIAIFAAAGCSAQIAPLHDLASLQQTTVEIGKNKFEAWLAISPEEKAQGLMFVRDLPADRGMLFLYDKASDAGIWMKNTYIELDIVFIASDGRIVKIFERARPHSLETMSPGQPVTAVLELKGGETARRGLKSGDHVTWASQR